ncbi:AfsR/SARP family transcriptional regulator [Saccharothrix stipae]
MELGLLGEVTARLGGRPVDLGPARQRCVLAALAVDAGRVVPVDLLLWRVWGVDTPRRAPATLHSHISRLRRALNDAGSDDTPIVLRSGGYALVLDRADQAVDLHRFRDLCARARATDDDAHAVTLLAEASALWRGDPLTGLSGEWVEVERDRLRQERLTAEHDLVDARLRVGEGEELVAELCARAAVHPLDERVAGQYLLALHRAGRSADALQHYQRLRERLVEELGTDPGEAVRELHRRILAADPALLPAPPSAVTGSAPPPTRAAPAPRQLPAAPAPFVGRRTELDRLGLAVGDAPGPVVISAIAGAGGIGKTWLALHWAHRHVDRFPDGQLFVDLRGFGPEGDPMPPAVAVRGFLDALGVEPRRLPVDPHANFALFRSLVADRRMLLVLDNAADTAQVTPLLPGGGSCTVVVTSRNRLPGLITGHGARHVPLDVLPDAEARALLTDRLGPARIDAEPAAVDALIELCGGYPLALSIIAGRAHVDPHLPLAVLAEELRDLGLDALHDDDPAASLPTVLSWSRRALTPDQARAFALLGAAPGPDIGLPAAASLVGLPPHETRAVLRGLEQASLLTQDGAGRYRAHDLIRRHAATSAREELDDGTREAALRRLLDFYTHTAHAADRLIHPHRPAIRLDPPAPGVHTHHLSDGREVLAWFEGEHANLLAAQHTAAGAGLHRTAWRLAWATADFLDRRGHLHDQLTVWRTALGAAEHLPEHGELVLAHRLLGRAHAYLKNHEEAIGHLRQALVLAERHHDVPNQAHTNQVLARAWERRGDHRQALAHATRALELYRALGEPVGEANALSGVAWFASRLGDFDAAREHCRAALSLYDRHHDPEGEANNLDTLAWVDHRTGRHADAVRRHERAIALFRDHGYAYRAADALDHLGHPHVALGDHDRARAVWREALELYRQQGRDDDADRVRRQLDELDRTRPVPRH